MKSRGRPMVQAELAQHDLGRVKRAELHRLALDRLGLCIENNLRCYPDAVSKCLLGDGVSCVSCGVVNARERMHAHISTFDATAVAGI
eukprot:4041905-Pyramimonas_sp.AAC.1